MHEVLVNRLGGLSIPMKSVVWLTDCPDMTLDVYHGRKTTTTQQQQQLVNLLSEARMSANLLSEARMSAMCGLLGGETTTSIPCQMPMPNIEPTKAVAVTSLRHTVDSRYLDFGYLEQPLISKRNSGPCLNLRSGNKILSIRGEIAPREQFLLFSTIF